MFQILVCLLTYIHKCVCVCDLIYYELFFSFSKNNKFLLQFSFKQLINAWNKCVMKYLLQLALKKVA